ncbi:DUF418 domain-containing protein [Actinomadura sp. WMMB 499]|uniref:DUF418 domain-containing protein n=1 Tax=Actinomadura sp. WMMB 499 TaxID=1219491 RepID=UPI00124518C1|nr:DUF418 domain-containing protein [Actinomadura sp. WMMB 499]QFG23703.1 DUF418 domain-containing protein [Actinomadura sp. WMMB 499]
MTGTMRAPRSRGMISGLLLVLLALWGGLIPFIGPYFDFGFGSSDAWVWSNDWLVLSVLPAIAVGLGGLILLFTRNRPFALVGGWLAALGGLWFVVGTIIAALWNMGVGTGLGGQARQITEQLTFFQGLGAIMIGLAALALGRFLVVGVRDARRAAAERAVGDRGDERLPGRADDRVGDRDRLQDRGDDRSREHADSEATAVPAQRKRGHFHLGRPKAGAGAGKNRQDAPRRRD